MHPTLVPAATIAAFALSCANFGVDAFLASTRQTTVNRTWQLAQRSSDDAGDEDMKEARKLLSKIWDNGDDKDEVNDTNSLPTKQLIRLLTHTEITDLDEVLPPPPPLTTAERDRRTKELKLLEELTTSDDVTLELEDLWASEKGAAAMFRLENCDDMLQAGQVIAAENTMIKLVDDYGVHWVEPLNRLATVYFRQGRFQESYHLWAVVLHLKPWHFGALESIVGASMRLGQRDQAQVWAKRGLPASTAFPYGEGPANPKRAEWVQDAIQQAQEVLAHLEYQTQKDFMGTPEDYYFTLLPSGHATTSSRKDQNDAWQ